MNLTKEQVPVELAMLAAPQQSRTKLRSAFGLHVTFRVNM